jgi:nucleoside-diphosphate-sugar epimerase
MVAVAAHDTLTSVETKPSTFYQGKTVVVCGGAGFVGSHLVDLLVEADACVFVVDNLSRGHQGKLKPGAVGDVIKPGAWFVYGDVGDEGTCRDNFKYSEPVDIIFNLAATVAGVIYNQSHHYEMFTENLRVLSTPLKIAAEYKVGHFLQTSSVCIYSPDHNHPCLESNGHAGHPTPANEGYSYAKRMGENVARWTAEESDTQVVTVRPSNIFGPRDYFDDKAHVIPALIKKVFSDEPTITAYGTGFERREFIYVTDVARGMMAAVEHGVNGQVYNLGTSGLTCVTIRDLLKMIQNIASTDKPVTFSQQHDPGDSARWSDAVKANIELNWYHQVGLQDGLERTINWYAEQRGDS